MLIVLDLDGVLADFTGGACAVHGRPHHIVTTWDWYKDWGHSDRDFWHPIEKMGFAFYPVYVKPYPWLDELLTLVKQFDWVLATANPLHPDLAASKVEWINKYIGKDAPVMMGNHKELLAKEGRLLIDDSDVNTNAFRGRGGMAVTFPQPWNKAKDNLKDRVGHIKRALEYYDDLLKRNKSA